MCLLVLDYFSVLKRNILEAIILQKVHDNIAHFLGEFFLHESEMTTM